jgi:4-amino-4-deoxy-L-arabinose transferase-like glycosyltransferase
MAFAFQGSRSLWAPDEGRYVSGAASMLDTGDFTVARLSHLPYLNKPPLTFWGIAAGLEVFGRNEWGARAFNAVCFVLTSALAGLLGYLMWGASEGLLAALVYATFPVAAAACNVVTPDTPLTLWSMLAMLCFWQSVNGAGRREPWKAALGLALGLGVLTKGPAALIPTGAMFAYLVLTRQTLRFFLSPWLLLGAILSVLPIVCWYVPVIQKVPGAAEYMWNSQVYGRIISGEFKRSPGLIGAVVTYGPILTAAALPWSAIAVIGLFRFKPATNTYRWWAALTRRPAALLLFLWAAIPTAVLCAASSKLPLYILPIFPGLAIAVARTCTLLWPNARLALAEAHPARWALMLGSCGALLLGAKCGAAYWPTNQDMGSVWQSIKPHLPDGPRRLVAVDQDFKGIAFYSGEAVTEVVTRDPYPDFVRSRLVDDEIADARHSEIPRIFLTKHKKLNKPPKRPSVPVPDRLRAAGIEFEDIILDSDTISPAGKWHRFFGAEQTGERHMFICKPGRDPAGTSRLAFVFDDGKGGLPAFNVAHAVTLLSREMNLRGVVLLNHAYCEGKADPTLSGLLARAGLPLLRMQMEGGKPRSFAAESLEVALFENTTPIGAGQVSASVVVGDLIQAGPMLHGPAKWGCLAVHELGALAASPQFQHALTAQHAQFAVSSDFHLYLKNAASEYDHHDLLAETRPEKRPPLLPKKMEHDKQLILIVTATAETCTFRVYNTLRTLRAEWTLK